MARKPRTRPSFFKVLMKDYSNKLSLPVIFVKKYGKCLPESVKLRTSSGGTWDVKLEETEECCFFREGWNKFTKDLELERGEFLVFWFSIGESTFDVSVYGVDACERQISSKDLLVDDSHTDEEFDFKNDCYKVPDVCTKGRRSFIPQSGGAAIAGDTNKYGNSGKEIHPRFEIVLTESRKSRWSLPRKFAEAAGLIGKRAVVLEYPPKNRCWPVILDQRPYPYYSLDMTVGWHDFRKENGLLLGETYSFEFDPTKNVILVKEHEKEQSDESI